MGNKNKDKIHPKSMSHVYQTTPRAYFDFSAQPNIKNQDVHECILISNNTVVWLIEPNSKQAELFHEFNGSTFEHTC